MNCPSPIHLLSHVSACLACFTVGCLSPEVPTTLQQLQRIGAGWSLVAVQVGNRMIPPLFRDSLLNPVRLMQIWGYEPGGSSATPWTRRFSRTIATPELPNDMAAIEPGRTGRVELSQPANPRALRSDLGGSRALKTNPTTV